MDRPVHVEAFWSFPEALFAQIVYLSQARLKLRMHDCPVGKPDRRHQPGSLREMSLDAMPRSLQSEPHEEMTPVHGRG